MEFPSNKKSIHEALAESQNKLIEHLQSSEKRYSNLVENLRDTVFQLDTEFRWSFVNRAGSIMTWFEAGQVLNREFIEHVAVQDTERCLYHFRSLISGKTREVSDRITYQRADGVERVFELACRAMKDEAESYNGIAGTLTDITERLKTENKVIHMAYHDSLTGLANRRLLHDYLQKKLQIQYLKLSYTALLYLDIDFFKQVNDLHGHIFGDKLLCVVSERLQAIFFEKDCIISRIGGDEFVICLSLHSSSLEEARSQFDAIAQQMLTVISEPLILGNGTLSCSASIGAVLLDGEKMDSDEALKLADLALYHAKRNGRNTSQFYDAKFEQQESQLRFFEQELEAAVELNQFRLYYQPQNEVISNKVVKLEALIRWIHPLKGIIYPENFIPYLERNGLITKVGAWVIDQGCCQLRCWIDKGITDVVLSVNVSAHQFKLDDFVDTVITSLEKYNIPAHQLELELTEGVAVADVDKTIKKMQAINKLGVLIALDDFGTGYSSLAYLKFFPIHTLKIDKSFTDGLPSDGYDTAIVKTTMVMAYHLGLTVVAEGVESIEQLEFLKKQGCQLYQGYLFSPPLEQEKIEKILLEDLR